MCTFDPSCPINVASKIYEEIAAHSLMAMIQTMRIVSAVLLTLSLASGWVCDSSRARRIPSLLISSASKQAVQSTRRRPARTELIVHQQQRQRISRPCPFPLHMSTRSDENRPASTGTYFSRATGSTKKSTDDMLRFIEGPIGSTVGDEVGRYELDEDLIEQLEKIVKAADGRKAQDLVVVTVGHVTTMTQALVICSGNSRPQNQAIANSVQEEMEDVLDRDVVPEGNPNSGWMILDYGSIMVHIPSRGSFTTWKGNGETRAARTFDPT
jgi:ribosome-associated protein